MAKFNIYFSKSRFTLVPLNRWDMFALLIILSGLFALAMGAKQMAGSYQIGEIIPISLDPSYLPQYALRTVLRIFCALILSLLFTFTIGTLAAKNKRAEKLIIPMIDILQSIPILGFLSITVMGFIHLFPGSMLGPECAAIFVIFTSQAWNMTLSFYQNLRMVPSDLIEATAMFHLSAWQRFWRVEVPFATPALLWNTMMSVSASWFFVVAAEAITVVNQNITLPGIGSYIGAAISQANGLAIIYAILTMLLVILIYDQLLFRPLVSWANKFKSEETSSENTPNSWLTRLLYRSYVYRYFGKKIAILFDIFINCPWLLRRKAHSYELPATWSIFLSYLWQMIIIALIIVAGFLLTRFISEHVTFTTVLHVLYLGFLTLLRVTAVLVICTLIWVPLGVWIGVRPKLATIIQPLMQFLAAFPANLVFPLIVILILRYHLNIEIWVTLLMLIGTQWYLAFNIIAGTIAIPKDLHHVINNFNVRGWLRWRRLILPAIFPFYVTGAITTVGASWNVSIVAEVVKWGDTVLEASGLGSFINETTIVGNFPLIALGIAAMSLYVLILNRLVWRPLYERAEKRFRLE